MSGEARFEFQRSLIWASPLYKGYVSSMLRMVQERMIPLLHPYVEVVNGEIHHRKRYGNYPGHGVIVEKESDSTSEELMIVPGEMWRAYRTGRHG